MTFSSSQVSSQFGPQEPEEPAVVAAEDVSGGRKVFRQHHHAAHGPGRKQGGGHEGHAQVSLTIFCLVLSHAQVSLTFVFDFNNLRRGFLFYLFLFYHFLFYLFLFSLFLSKTIRLNFEIRKSESV